MKPDDATMIEMEDVLPGRVEISLNAFMDSFGPAIAACSQDEVNNNFACFCMGIFHAITPYSHLRSHWEDKAESSIKIPSGGITL